MLLSFTHSTKREVFVYVPNPNLPDHTATNRTRYLSLLLLLRKKSDLFLHICRPNLSYLQKSHYQDIFS
ncbi:hypothetical protein MRB53_005633 [Persea americana]|uniref:Uncharacterized protein n=1 Tax=Persea americana TaxID=3435 RepID=A0ACC2MDW0_PERAE|nr:hypothetical protein MRB53_005633 [Persea americana]